MCFLHNRRLCTKNTYTFIMDWFSQLARKISSQVSSLYTIAKGKPLYARAIFLALCVAMTKCIVVFNEETLVALTFVLFVDFSLFYFSQTVQESLDERSAQIQKEMERSYVQRKQVLVGSIEELKKESAFPEYISKWGQLTTQTMRMIVAPEIKSLLYTQIRERMNAIRSSRGKNLPSLQTHLADHFVLATHLNLYRVSESKEKGSIADDITAGEKK